MRNRSIFLTTRLSTSGSISLASSPSSSTADADTEDCTSRFSSSRIGAFFELVIGSSILKEVDAQGSIQCLQNSTQTILEKPGCIYMQLLEFKDLNSARHCISETKPIYSLKDSAF